MMYDRQDLKRFQSESLEEKIQRSYAKISEWYSNFNGEVYVSFSGGKDSTVLADMCAQWCQITGRTLNMLYIDTGLEYPEVRSHAKQFSKWLEQKYGIQVVLDIKRPSMRFDEVIKKYGYPVISKEVSECVYEGRSCLESNGKKYCYRLNKLLGTAVDKDGKTSIFNQKKYEPLLYTDFVIGSKCCTVMKKNPAHEYGKQTGMKPITAQMDSESRLREKKWLQHGCNGFDMKQPISNPMSFWTEQDVLKYIVEHNLSIASVYGEIVPKEMQISIDDTNCKLCTTGCERTGCIFCGFGAHLEKGEGRFLRLKRTHPKQYQYCIGGGEYNESGIWQPNKDGLGMGHVFDKLNELYGDDFIKYK